MRKVFRARWLLTPVETIEEPVLVVEDGVITALFSRESGEVPAGAEVVDFGGATLGPAYLDVHLHGSAGRDVMEGTEEAAGTIGAFVARRGVAGYLATTVTASMYATLHALSKLAGMIGRGPVEGAAEMVGIHIEGPFLSCEKRGVHPPEYLQTPTVALLEQLWEAAEGKIRLMTIAPELHGAEEVIARAVELGVRVSLGHSNATAEAARRGVAAGAVSATHTFNAMRRFDHREPGILGVVLDGGTKFAEVICDGHHVDAAVVRLFWRAVGAERAILVTDGTAACGMPDGTYTLGGLEIEVRDGVCLLDGVLAGSALTMDLAVENFLRFTGAGLGEAVGLAGRNPARMLGLEGRFGSLAVGRRGDFLVLGEGGRLLGVVLGGVVVG